MHYSRNRVIFSLILGSALLANAPNLRAECIICDELVTLDTAQATCFVQNYEEIISKLTSALNGRMSLDLDACTVEGEALNARSGLVTLPTLDDGVETDIGSSDGKSVYLLDKQGVSCLHDLVNKHPGPLDPSAVFDLFEECPR